MFDTARQEIDEKAGVVIAVPILYARQMAQDPRHIYTTYEKLCGAEARTASPLRDDSKRRAIGGLFFGEHADRIRYGALSLDDRGLANYGKAFLRLHDYAIKDRVSFCEENTFIFCEEHRINISEELPTGYLSTWIDRADLAITKIADQLSETLEHSVADLLLAQGDDRNSDRCVEAHIFGPLTIRSVSSVAFWKKGLSKQDKIDLKAVEELFSKLQEEIPREVK